MGWEGGYHATLCSVGFLSFLSIRNVMLVCILNWCANHIISSLHAHLAGKGRESLIIILIYSMLGLFCHSTVSAIKKYLTLSRFSYSTSSRFHLWRLLTTQCSRTVWNYFWGLRVILNERVRQLLYVSAKKHTFIFSYVRPVFLFHITYGVFSFYLSKLICDSFCPILFISFYLL